MQTVALRMTMTILLWSGAAAARAEPVFLHCRVRTQMDNREFAADPRIVGSETFRIDPAAGDLAQLAQPGPHWVPLCGQAGAVCTLDAHRFSFAAHGRGFDSTVEIDRRSGHLRHYTRQGDLESLSDGACTAIVDPTQVGDGKF